MNDFLARLRFPAVCLGILASLWGLGTMARLQREVAEGRWEPADPELFERACQAAVYKGIVPLNESESRCAAR